MMSVPERYRLPVAAIASLAVVAVVVAAILFVGSPAPSPVRAFFAAFAQARRTDDPLLMRPFVTGEQSSAYLSVQGFLLGEKAVKKASVLTVQQLDDITVETAGTTSTVRLAYTEGGYNISLDTGQPIETPNVLAPRNVTVELRQIDGRWLVDSYEARPQ
jgi:hypothetical protein